MRVFKCVFVGQKGIKSIISKELLFLNKRAYIEAVKDLIGNSFYPKIRDRRVITIVYLGIVPLIICLEG